MQPVPNDGNPTIDRGPHLDMWVADDGPGSNSDLIEALMNTGAPVDFVIPANVAAEYGLKTSTAGNKDGNGLPTEAQVPITRAPQAGGIQMLRPFAPKHMFSGAT